MKKLVVLVLLGAMLICTACGKKNQSAGGEPENSSIEVQDEITADGSNNEEKSDPDEQNQETDSAILELPDYEEHVDDKLETDDLTYEVVDARYLVLRDSGGERRVGCHFDSDIKELYCGIDYGVNGVNPQQVCVIRVADEENDILSRLYVYDVESGKTEEMFTCPIISCDMSEDGLFLIQLWNGRYCYGGKATANAVVERDIPDAILKPDNRIGKNDRIMETKPSSELQQEQIEAYLAFCAEQEAFVVKGCDTWTITPDGRLLDASGAEHENVERAMPATLYASEGMIFYADRNVIHCMKENGTDDQVIYVAPDTIYEMQGTAEYLFFAMPTAVWRLHIPSGIVDVEVSDLNESFSMRVRDYRTVELYDNRAEGFYAYKGRVEQCIGAPVTCLQGIVEEGTLPENAVCGSYVYNGTSYVVWGEQGSFSIGMRTPDGLIIRLCSQRTDSSFTGVLPSTQDGMNPDITLGGDDACAYLKWGTVIYYANYSTRQLEYLMLETPVIGMKVYDGENFLLKLEYGPTVYITYDKEAGRLIQNDTLTEEMLDEFRDAGDTITTYEGYDVGSAVPADEKIYSVLANGEKTYLFLCTEKHIYRYSCENGDCIRLEGEIPSHAYGLDIMEDNTVTLIEINYPCWGPVEGFLAYEGREIHFGLPK